MKRLNCSKLSMIWDVITGQYLKIILKIASLAGWYIAIEKNVDNATVKGIEFLFSTEEEYGEDNKAEENAESK